MTSLASKTTAAVSQRSRERKGAGWKPARAKEPGKGRGASLGIELADTPALIRKIEAGLSFEALQRLESYSGLSLATIASVVGIPERTLARRKVAGSLSPEESERLVRIAYLVDQTLGLFEGDRESAARWLTSPKKALEGQRPIEYARTELGAREVENLLGRLENGVFS